MYFILNPLDQRPDSASDLEAVCFCRLQTHGGGHGLGAGTRREASGKGFPHARRRFFGKAENSRLGSWVWEGGGHRDTAWWGAGLQASRTQGAGEGPGQRGAAGRKLGQDEERSACNLARGAGVGPWDVGSGHGLCPCPDGSRDECAAQCTGRSAGVRCPPGQDVPSPAALHFSCLPRPGPKYPRQLVVVQDPTAGLSPAGRHRLHCFLRQLALEEAPASTVHPAGRPATRDLGAPSLC